MGYQESYVTTKNKKDFEYLVKHIQSVGADYYERHWCNPVEIITFTDNSSMQPKLKKGCKAIYFIGERYPQSNKARILGYMADDDEYNSEECKLKMWEWLDKIKIIFTEEVHSDAIWGENGIVRTAVHEEFKFD